jgi:hypothetical protein
MPYIKKTDREIFDKVLDKMPFLEQKGQLEYCIFKLMLQYMEGREPRYSILHDCTYAAQHCADEFRRRFLDERENKAREENGDVTT